MQDNHITALLNLKGLTVIHFENLEDSVHFHIESTERPSCCPVCSSTKIEAHDKREQRIKDIPVYNKPTFLHFFKKRYRCRCCSKRFSPPIPFVEKKSQMTNRLKFSLVKSLTNCITFKHIAKTNFVSPSSVLRFFGLFSVPRKPLPEVLCIDEFKGNADGIPYQTAIADGKNHCLIDILPTRNFNYLYSYSMDIPLEERDKVKIFVSDMNKGFKRLKQTCYSKAIHVIDRYHFVRQVEWGLQNVRKKVQASLSDSLRKYYKRSRMLLSKPYKKLKDSEKDSVTIMLRNNKELQKAYYIAHIFFEKVLSSKGYREAKQNLQEWIELAKQSGQQEWNESI